MVVGGNIASGGAERGGSLRPEQLLWTLGKKKRAAFTKLCIRKDLRGKFWKHWHEEELMKVQSRRRKNQQITQVPMFIHNRLNLNMFRASLCPSSGEQTV